MAANIKTKESFGTLRIDHFSPAATDAWPKAINVHLSFEEALKLHLGLGQALAQLNTYNRSTVKGRRSAVNLCLYTQTERISINEGQTKRSSNGDA